MSSVVKGVKKVFKSVVKAVKKVAVPLLAAGALVFTAGAALGVASLAAGWGGAASAIASSVGASGVVGSALTGAITQAGYGALIGGTVSAASGGSFTEGARVGAAAGAITGGATGALRGGLMPKAGGTMTDTTSGHVKTFPYDPGRPGPGTVIDESGAVGAPQAPGVRGGLISRVGGWAKENPELAGGLIQGVGSALTAGANADAERDLVRERYTQVRQNYAGADPGSAYRSADPARGGLMPSQRFDPSYYGSWEYRYDPNAGRIVRVPVE